VIPAQARQNYQTASARMTRDAIRSAVVEAARSLEHPRKIFDDNSDAANAIREWSTR
jgi:hypothetical protein